ncbi:hypothetical protein [Streptantibioticus ferralitis]|uniref:Uncharacterized protein n=1 Tax=Streptantibioticus ferralitis TaxID=236510 RepID=A0ABT5Z404_9ACTN|nr:hypothetical protein [Streptantibioticus ferralitis]MDF2258561.1 hypothetical protein [Streptantibioticus ferralitis]
MNAENPANPTTTAKTVSTVDAAKDDTAGGRRPRRPWIFLVAGLGIGTMWSLNDFRPDPYHLLRLAVVLFVGLPTVVLTHRWWLRRTGRAPSRQLPLRWLMLGKLVLLGIASALTALLTGTTRYPYTITGALLLVLTVVVGHWAATRQTPSADRDAT